MFVNPQSAKKLAKAKKFTCLDHSIAELTHLMRVFLAMSTPAMQTAREKAGALSNKMREYIPKWTLAGALTWNAIIMAKTRKEIEIMCQKGEASRKESDA
jgi:hypothetical protein